MAVFHQGLTAPTNSNATPELIFNFVLSLNHFPLYELLGCRLAANIKFKSAVTRRSRLKCR